MARIKPDAFDSVINTNLKGAFFLSQAVLRPMIRQKSGRIINITSVVGLMGNPGQTNYAASKAGMLGLTKSLARALAPGIRVNAVCPGPINSRWLRTGLTEEQIADRIAPFPIPKLAEPSDIADTVFYLAVETGLTTGQLLTVDGGRTM